MSKLYKQIVSTKIGKIITSTMIYSAQEIFQKVDETTTLLFNLGLKKGDRVAVQAKKSEYIIFLYLACLKSGLIFLPLNVDYKIDELAYFFTDATPSLIICDPTDESNILIIRPNEACQIKTLNQKGEGSFYHDTSYIPKEHVATEVEDEDIASIIYTSGTTGHPKGAMISHFALLQNARALIDCWRLSPQDTILHMLPLFHVHGLFFALNTVLLAGANLILLPKFDLEVFFKYLPSTTVFMGVPTHYSRLLSDVRLTPEYCQHLRIFISGSAPLLPAIFQAFNHRTGHIILERYGMTETGINSSNPLEGKRKVGSVGLPLAGVNIRIVDDNNQKLPILKTGHIQIKGDNLFSGYWMNAIKTQTEFTDDGYFKTGDLGVVDEDGYVFIVGRAKDMVISGGLNVYPKEIEQTIDAITGVHDSAVIGLPHPDFGEVVVAVVVVDNNLTEEDIMREVKKRHAGYKCPKKIFLVSELPKNTMGKVQKNMLRSQFHHHF